MLRTRLKCRAWAGALLGLWLWSGIHFEAALAAGQPPYIPVEYESGKHIRLISRVVNANRDTEADELIAALKGTRNHFWQDDIHQLVLLAESASKQGKYEYAIKICDYILEVPARPRAHQLSLTSPPWDFRGDARWIKANALRKGGHWTYALTEYRLNRRQFPRLDNCTTNGEGIQRMALSEGICLEHLGRYNEAVEMYWLAAANRRYDYLPPLALRRLTDIYLAAGQEDDLKAQVYEECRRNREQGDWRLDKDEAPGPATPEREAELDRKVASVYLGQFQWRTETADMIRTGNWNGVVDALLQVPNEWFGEQGRYAPQWYEKSQRAIEVVDILCQHREESIPVLEAAVTRHPDARALQDALSFLNPVKYPPSNSSGIQRRLTAGQDYRMEFSSSDFPPIPQT